MWVLDRFLVYGIIAKHSTRKRSMQGIKFTTKTFIETLRNRYGDKFDYSQIIYVDHVTPVVLVCPIHGAVEIRPKQLLHAPNRFGCSACGKAERKRLSALTAIANGKKSFEQKALKKHGGKYTYTKVEYVTSKVKVIITCPKHGDFLQQPVFHLLGDGCKKCAVDLSSIRYRKSFETFLEQAVAKHGKLYSYNEATFVNNRKHTEVTCEKHGAFWVTPANHITRGSGCPRCSNSVSSQESKILSAFPLFEQTNKSVIKPYHLDLYSEMHQMAIEVNGRYWHSEATGKSNDYHLMKTEKCLSKGIKLLHFWDDEVNEKFDIVQSMINSHVGGTTKVYARSTKVVSLSTQLVTEFLSKNHLQGSTGCAFAYGLELDGELVSVMTFGVPRFTTGVDYEMIRFSSKLNFTIVGGASKLFKHFVKEHQPESVVTYADRRYSEGAVYSLLGFDFLRNTKPNYFYTKDGRNTSRYSAQKHKLPKLLGDSFDITLSEVDNMTKAGYSRVFDCGNKVFVWTPPT